MVQLARVTVVAILCLCLCMVSAGPALAGGGGDNNGHHNGPHDPKHHGDPVPEIDPGSAMSAITLLTGGMLLLAKGRLRKK